MTAPLDPVIAQIIPLLPLRDPETMTPQSARDPLRALAAARAAVPPPPVASVRDIEVEGAAAPLAARVYRVSQETSPTVVFFHGGGWVAGDLETHDRQARLLAIETGAVVVSVDYRRPPETRFPGAFEDSFAAARDVFARIAEFGGDNARARRRRRQRGRQSGGNRCDRLSRCRHRSRRAIAGLSHHRRRRKLRGRDRERALPLAGGKRRRLFPVARGDGVVRRPLSRGHKARRGLARFALARKKPRRARTGGGLHGVVRSLARRGQGLCRSACGCRACRRSTIMAPA